MGRIDINDEWRQLKNRVLFAAGKGFLFPGKEPLESLSINFTSACSLANFCSMMCMPVIQADLLRPTRWHRSATVTAASFNSFLL